VPIKGREAGSVLVLPVLFDWHEQAHGARLLGLVPTMYKPRRGDSRQWLADRDRLALRSARFKVTQLRGVHMAAQPRSRDAAQRCAIPD